MIPAFAARSRAASTGPTPSATRSPPIADMRSWCAGISDGDFVEQGLARLTRALRLSWERSELIVPAAGVGGFPRGGMRAPSWLFHRPQAVSRVRGCSRPPACLPGLGAPALSASMGVAAAAMRPGPPLELVAHREPPGAKVHIVPAQPERLALALPQPEGHRPARSVTLAAGDLEHRPGLSSGQRDDLGWRGGRAAHLAGWGSADHPGTLRRDEAR